MKRSNLFAMVALVPLALNVSAPASGTILMPLCTGDGQVRMVPVSGSGPAPAGSDNGCCIKGCHSGSNRKRLPNKIEPAQ